jgi:O-methyltransferase
MLKPLILRFFNARGFQIVRSSAGFSAQELQIMQQVKEHTSSGPERLTGLMNAVRYLVENKIPGDFVECGVWRGGSMMAAMSTLINLGDTSRRFHLFDTFEGMSAPTEKDVMFDGQKASDLLNATKKAEGPGNYWCWAGIEDVRASVASTGYPMDRINLVKGKVEDTIPAQAPAQIALLRLDTDWYESTAHELEHLYPRLSPNGVLIIDDYGHWQGARRAVDEYFAKAPFKPLLTRMDYTGRMAVKPGST